MSDIRVAAKRVVEAPYYATGNNPKPNEFVWSGNPADAIDVAQAYLAEHPEDGDEPATEEWLRTIGFERLMQSASDNHLSLGHPASATFINAMQPHRSKQRTWYVGGDILPLALQPTTRGDVRRLCASLGIDLCRGRGKPVA